MPLGRKHLRRSRDAPTGGIGRKKNHFQTSVKRTGSQIIGLIHPLAAMPVLS